MVTPRRWTIRDLAQPDGLGPDETSEPAGDA